MQRNTSLTFTSFNIPELQEMMESNSYHIKQCVDSYRLFLDVLKTEHKILRSEQSLFSFEDCYMYTFRLTGYRLKR